jgi:uncharacterized phage protein (TIGR02220 family)
VDGWVGLYRKLLDSRVFTNPDLLKVWIWCLLKANHKKRWVPIKTGKGETEVEVGPGQFVFGRFSAAKKLKMNPNTVKSRMQKLKSMGNITTQNKTHYSIISIVNWESYQTGNLKQKTKFTNQTPTKHQPNTTDNNDNNVNKKRYVPFQEIISHLNLMTGKKFQHGTAATKQTIRARWNDGFILEDFKSVIDIKCAQWKTDPKMELYLRPQTLFGTKFESYLNEKSKPIEYNPHFKTANE